MIPERAYDDGRAPAGRRVVAFPVAPPTASPGAGAGVPLVAALVLDPLGRERLRGALSGRMSLHFLDRPDTLRRRLGEGEVSLVIVEPTDASGRSTAPLVEWIRAQFPALPVVGYCGDRGAASADILPLARAGVHDLIIRDLDDSRHRLLVLVSAARGRCVAEEVLAGLASGGVARDALALIRAYLDAAHRPVAPEDVAAILGVSRRTLFSRHAAAGLPTPRELVGWSRLLLAARMLDDRGCSIERAALDLDFPSPNALRNLLQRYVGVSPTELRHRGGSAYLAARLSDAVRRGRMATPAGSDETKAG